MDKDLLKLPIISLRQPWAWMIVNGYKDIENRTWSTRFRGKVLIHAGKKWDEGIMPADIKAMYGIEIPRRLKTGGIVGMAEITDCVNKSKSPWFFGPYGFTLANAKPLPFYPCKGKMGFFRLLTKDLENKENLKTTGE